MARLSCTGANSQTELEIILAGGVPYTCQQVQTPPLTPAARRSVATESSAVCNDVLYVALSI